jgi:hypothetical protein
MRPLRAILAATAAATLVAAVPPATAASPAPHPDDGPERAVAALWRAMSHAPGARADIDTLRALFHPQAVVFGSRQRDGRPSVRRIEIREFLVPFEAVEADGFHECEIARTVRVHDRFASIDSVVESRADPDDPEAEFTGINSLQLYRTDAGWQVLSLYYHVAPDDRPIPHDGTSGRCLD